MFMKTTYKELVGGEGGGDPKALGSRSSVMKTIIFLGCQFLLTLVLHKWTNYLEKLLSLRITFKRSYKCKADIRTEQVKHHLS